MKLTRQDLMDTFVNKTKRLNLIDSVVYLSMAFVNLVYVLYRKNIIDKEDVEYILQDE